MHKKRLKEFFIGPALENSQLESEKLKVVWGLPIYSSDTISSVAYAGEEVLMVLFPVMALMATRSLVWVMTSIIGLLAILVFCYCQTIDAYPQGGGAYIVGADNLGEVPGLVAAAALLVGYILTVAVSSCSGAAAIVSAFPAAEPYKAWIAFAIVCFLTWGNLRGVRESSVMFGLPTYFFIFSLLAMIVTGFVKVFVLGYEPPTPQFQMQTVGDISLFLFLRAFASGCTALTGVEAVSNGVPSFKEPSARNAKIVLILMALVVGTTFISVAVLTNLYHIVPQEGVTAIASLAAAIFGHSSVFFYVFQIATVIILSLATNTAFAGMPLLLAMIAQDGYMPRQFTQRGARLNFSNGVLLIFITSSLLIFAFRADTHSLLPLYATGVFVSFTISQAGMYRHWTKSKAEGWRHKAVINGVGTIICFAVCLLIAGTRFLSGAWLVVIVIPLLVLLMKRIHDHYTKIAASLVITGDPEAELRREAPEPVVLMPVQSVNRPFVKCLNYVLSLGLKNIEFYYVSSGDGREEQLRQQLEALHIPGARFVSEVTLLRNTNEVLLRHIDEMQKNMSSGQTLTVVLSQLTCEERWASTLHNQTSIQLKLALNQRRNVSYISVPYIS